MRWKYWIDWLFLVAVKFLLAAAAFAISVAIFMGGIKSSCLIGIGMGLGLNIVALVIATSFLKTMLIPWKGAKEEFIPFYTRKWESYKEYKKNIEWEKQSSRQSEM